MAVRAGLAPAAFELTARCSTIELPDNKVVLREEIASPLFFSVEEMP